MFQCVCEWIRFTKGGSMPGKYWRLVVFHNGKRIEKKAIRTRANTEALVAKRKELLGKGIKVRLVGLTDSRLYPPVHEIQDNRDAGKMWCPHCGDWSYFKVPKYKPHAEIGTDDWFNNSYYRQGIKVCSWCGISEAEWYVCRANNSFHEVTSVKRRKRGRKVRSSR